jgi:transposase-like protein
MAKELDGHVEEFRTRRLDDAGLFTFCRRRRLGAQGPRGRPGGRLVATGVNADGHREILAPARHHR